MASVFDHLPAAVRTLAVELADGWPAEPRADCASCPLAADPVVPYPFAFSPETKCCTAHPMLVNFLVGRALARGEPSRSLVIARLADRAGVTARAIGPSDEYAARYRRELDAFYGRDVAMRCPFWVGGERSCGIWADRPSLCRAWSCRHEQGIEGGMAWRAADALESAVELRVAELLVARGTPPTDDDPEERWLVWFAWCADEVVRLDERDLAPLAAEPALATARTELIAIRRTRPPLPDVVAPAISNLITLGGEVMVAGYSTFDPVRAPRAVFVFLARLDGTTPWRTALGGARAELGDPPWLDEALVRELHRIGAIV